MQLIKVLIIRMHNCTYVHVYQGLHSCAHIRTCTVALIMCHGFSGHNIYAPSQYTSLCLHMVSCNKYKYIYCIPMTTNCTKTLPIIQETTLLNNDYSSVMETKRVESPFEETFKPLFFKFTCSIEWSGEGIINYNNVTFCRNCSVVT